MLQQKQLTRQFVALPVLVRHFLLSWLLAVLVEYCILPPELRDLGKLEGLAQMSLCRVLVVTFGLSIALTALHVWIRPEGPVRWALVAVLGLLTAITLMATFTWAMLAACVLILALGIVYARFGWNFRPEELPEPQQACRAQVWATVALSLLFFLFVSVWTVGRVLSFSTPSYDFGIFSQMFYSMKETGLPMTTLERDGVLSHFAVHVSPIYYLLLPIYCLAPTPATLQVLQAAVMTSAVVPLWQLGKHHGLSGGVRTLLCALLLLYPAYAGGTSYDIHENCFLTPLILWLFYGIDRKNIPVTAMAAVLTLMVKEDAPVYVAVIGLWLLAKTALHFRKSEIPQLVTGAALLAVSVGWFFLVTGYLAKNGDGVMTYRYENFMYDGSASLVAVLKAVFLNPMKTVYECVDGEKLPFIAMTLLPLLGIPLLTRRYERYLLLIPYILVNLMSDYQYQHDLFFQYNFGPTAFLIYLTAVNLADLKRARKRLIVLAVAVAVSAGGFAAVIVPQAVVYPKLAIEYREYYQNVRNALDTIPEDASVAATTFYTTHLSGRQTLYDIRYCSREHLLEAEYVVLKLSDVADYARYATDGEKNGLDHIMRLLQDHGYKEYHTLDGVLVIYRKG